MGRRHIGSRNTTKEDKVIEYTVIGYTTNKGLLIDLDYVDYERVESLADVLLRVFKLEGYIITESSPECYHIIFNKRLSWSKVCKIMAHACFWTKNRGLKTWLLLQLIKESCTLRIGTKGAKPSPQIIKTFGKQDKMCKEYLEVYETFNKK